MAKTHFERWEEIFQPLTNHLDPNANANGLLFETYGKEVEHVVNVANTEPNKVWTMVEGDNGKWYISQGYHLVNRVGYFITQKAYDPTDPKHARFGERDTLYC